MVCARWYLPRLPDLTAAVCAADTAFQGDVPALTAARHEVRKHFTDNASRTDPADVATLCAEGREALAFLTQSVVQGRLNKRGNYGARLWRSPRAPVVCS